MADKKAGMEQAKDQGRDGEAQPCTIIYVCQMHDGTTCRIPYYFSARWKYRVWARMVRNLQESAERVKLAIEENQYHQEDGWNMWLSACHQFINHWGLDAVPDDIRFAIDDARANAFGDGPLEQVQWPPSARLP